jgi:hypothetical protein
MSSNRERGDKSFLLTTIVMLVLRTINEPKPKRLFAKRLGYQLKDTVHGSYQRIRATGPLRAATGRSSGTNYR